MAKDFSRFGGGLRVFQVIAALNFLLALFAAGLAVEKVITASQEYWQLTVLNLVASLALATLMGWLVISMPRRGGAAARRINILAWTSVGVVFVHSLLEARLQVDLGSVEEWKDAFDFPIGISWLLFLIAYMQSANRARVYYKLPAREEADTGPAAIPDAREMLRGYGGLFLGFAVGIVPIMLILFLVMYLAGANL